MNRVFADTFFFLAYLNPHDASHRSAADYFDGFEGEMVTTEWVLAELADGMAGVGDRDAFVGFHAALRSDPSVIIVPSWPESFREGLALYAARLDKEWTLTDCISFVVMQSEHLSEALTGDHHFRQAGFKPLLQ
jgi:predicted nucleic acid-binding protein